MVSTLNRLRQTQVERFFARATGSHAAAIFLREVLYWLSPSKKAPARPRSTVYRNGNYWIARTQKQWDEEHCLSRSKLATVYARCEDFIEIDHFMFGCQRQTHYRIKFEKLLELMERDETLQACLQSDLSAIKSRRAIKAAPCSPVNSAGCSPILSLGDVERPAMARMPSTVRAEQGNQGFVQRSLAVEEPGIETVGHPHLSTMQMRIIKLVDRIWGEQHVMRICHQEGGYRQDDGF